MTAFWILASLLALLAVMTVALPGLRGRTPAGSGRRPALLVAGCFLAVALATALYLRLTNWSWQAVAPEVQQSIDELNALRRAAEASPQDVQAWSRLGSAYLHLEEFQAAQRAYERANRIAQGRDADALAGLAETGLLGGAASGAMAAGTAERAAQQFEQVLVLDPGNGKALFYSAVIAMQSGNPALARQRFAAMRDGNVPPEVAAALDKQIAALDEQLKPAAVDAATAIRLTVRVSDSMRSRVPAQAPLFVFVRGATGGPPLAVRRLTTALPVELTLSAADSMIAGNGLKPGQAITVVARVSASGGPIAQSGDPYGEVSSIAGAKGLRTLTIDRLTP